MTIKHPGQETFFCAGVKLPERLRMEVQTWSDRHPRIPHQRITEALAFHQPNAVGVLGRATEVTRWTENGIRHGICQEARSAGSGRNEHVTCFAWNQGINKAGHIHRLRCPHLDRSEPFPSAMPDSTDE